MRTEFIHYHDKNELEIRVTMDIARDVTVWSESVMQTVIKEAIIEELTKSPDLQEKLRKLALERLVEFVGAKKTL